MKVAATWTLTADSESYYDVVEWLDSEDISDEQVALNKKADENVSIQFTDLDAAFRFRMQFDEVLVNS